MQATPAIPATMALVVMAAPRAPLAMLELREIQALLVRLVPAEMVVPQAMVALVAQAGLRTLEQILLRVVVRHL